MFGLELIMPRHIWGSNSAAAGFGRRVVRNSRLEGSASDGAIHSLSEGERVRFIEVMWSARLGST
ncbi:unnamed protein product [Tuber aestivum]|uniref:Uncharacterized protein n=1 Tax=Tuber aestivum TaxID=59557 RepID=A0A292Q6W2_9PEZI|nr:unnamed protein product [Tuber aestivum]